MQIEGCKQILRIKNKFKIKIVLFPTSWMMLCCDFFQVSQDLNRCFPAQLRVLALNTTFYHDSKTNSTENL